jgi:dephospho-CoA kinase
VGLTGGLGAGKSEALRALEELGAVTLSTDAVVHELLATDELRELLVERLGGDVAPNGEVDRSAVAERAFGDPEHRSWLEGELWPRVGRRVMEFKEQAGAAEEPPVAAVVEVPLLFEAGMEDAFDHTVAVIAEEPIREQRAGARGHTAVASRAGRQLPQSEKARRADFVVRNDGSLEELKQSLSHFLATIGTQ